MILALIIEGARQKPGRGRLADAAHPGQHEGMGDAVHLERIAQRAHHRLLTDQVGEEFGAVFARQHLIGRLAGAGRGRFFLRKHGESRVVALIIAGKIGFVSHR